MKLLIPDDLHKRHARNGKRSASPRAPAMNTELDLRGRRSDGSEFTMDVGLSPLEAHRGNLVIVSVRDLSEQKESSAGNAIACAC